MKICYQDVIDWFSSQYKMLIALEVACLLAAGGYFALAPRIYEANFSIGLPKVPAPIATTSGAPRLKTLISPQEFIRPTQDPMTYSTQFIEQCMGQDTDANRKKFINALQMSVKQQGDVIAFTLRLEGSQKLLNCANLMMRKFLQDLTITQDNYLKSIALTELDKKNIAPPTMVQVVRISDSYVKPDLSRLLTIGALAGIFLAVFISVMRKKYRA
jgi:uncharacterized protein involved in exopolysaccharide biosynthesis